MNESEDDTSDRTHRLGTNGSDEHTLRIEPSTEERSRGDRAAAIPSGARIGSYVLKRELGRGGQGVVYEAEDTRLGRSVALKVLAQAFASDAPTRLRFEREAGALARLDHPGICTVYEAGVADGVPFIAMRLVVGATLAERIRKRSAESGPGDGTSSVAGGRRRRIAFDDAEIVEQAARALHIAHEAGLVHRDMKPGNIMVEADGRPIVLDFGLVRDAGAASSAMTTTGSVFGTPAYMSPEQADGTRALDRRSDVWSLGVTLYETVTGRKPFEAPTMEGLLRAIRTEEPVDPRAANPAVTPELAAVILTAMDKDPARRYGDAAAMAEDIARARRLEPVLARPAGRIVRARRWVERNPVVAIALVVVVLSLGTGLTTALRGLDRAEAALERESTAKADALEKRREAEDLLSFLVVDLHPKLDAVGRLDLLDDAARKTEAFFAGRPVDPENLPETMRRAISLRNVGDVLRAAGDQDGARARYLEAAELFERLLERHPNEFGVRKESATTLNALAAADLVRGDRKRALERAEESLAMRRRAVEAEPNSEEAAEMFAAGLVMHGNVLKANGRNKEAVSAYRDGIAAWEKVVERRPKPRSRRELAVGLQNLGESLRLEKKLDEAVAMRRRGLEIFDDLVRAEPRNREFQEQAATGRHGLAMIERSRRNFEAARTLARTAAAMLDRLASEDPGNSRRWYQAGHSANVLAILEGECGDPEAAFKAHSGAREARARLTAIDPKNANWAVDLADSSLSVLRLMSETAASFDLDEASREVLKAARQAAALETDDGGHLADVARIVEGVGEVMAAEGSPERARAASIEALALRRRVVAAKSEPGSRLRLWFTLTDGADQAFATGRFEEARALAAEAKDLNPEATGVGARESDPWLAAGRYSQAANKEALALVELGRLGEARAVATAALERAEAGRKLEKRPGDLAIECLRSESARVACALREGSLNAARSGAAAASAIWKELPKEGREYSGERDPRELEKDIAVFERYEAGEAPRTARERLALARYLLRSGKAARAFEPFDLWRADPTAADLFDAGVRLEFAAHRLAAGQAADARAIRSILFPDDLVRALGSAFDRSRPALSVDAKKREEARRELRAAGNYLERAAALDPKGSWGAPPEALRIRLSAR